MPSWKYIVPQATMLLLSSAIRISPEHTGKCAPLAPASEAAWCLDLRDKTGLLPLKVIVCY